MFMHCITISTTICSWINSTETVDCHKGISNCILQILGDHLLPNRIHVVLEKQIFEIPLPYRGSQCILLKLRFCNFYRRKKKLIIFVNDSLIHFFFFCEMCSIHFYTFM
ncbi:hypothetical protein EGW08_005292 [Elysia chlorotica]|uniref:Uncharacterized protein n=1 Tax=Elysia chlorotica TaxID=188477 RepID=A0A433TZG8_ELYCH|nr:hypothetical protein EGW08_005292 [Elysia chlorotica]